MINASHRAQIWFGRLCIDLSEAQVDRVMSFFDRDGDGTISFNEFLEASPAIVGAPLDFVHQAFDILDKSGDGVVTVEDLKMAYDASWHPDVKEGTQIRKRCCASSLTSLRVAMAIVTAWSQSKSSRSTTRICRHPSIMTSTLSS